MTRLPRTLLGVSATVAIALVTGGRSSAQQPSIFAPGGSLPVLDAYLERNVEKAMEVFERDRTVDELYTSLFRELVTYMLEDPRTISRCIDMMFIAKNLERIGDHATNIAEKIHYMIHGSQINRPRHEAES